MEYLEICLQAAKWSPQCPQNCIKSNIRFLQKSAQFCKGKWINLFKTKCAKKNEPKPYYAPPGSFWSDPYSTNFRGWKMKSIFTLCLDCSCSFISIALLHSIEGGMLIGIQCKIRSRAFNWSLFGFNERIKIKILCPEMEKDGDAGDAVCANFSQPC